MLAVGLSTSAVYLQNTQQAVATAAAAGQVHTDVVATSPTGFTAAASAEVTQALRAVPGVVAASPVVASAGYVETPRPTGVAAQWTPGPARHAVRLQGLDAVTGAGILGPRVRSGDLSALHGDTVALSLSAVRSSGYRIGDRVPLRLGDGSPVVLRLVAVVADVPGADGPSAYLPVDLAAAHSTTGVQAIALSTDPTAATAAAAGIARAVARLADDHPGLTVSAGATGPQTPGTTVNTWAGYLLAVLVTGYALVALVNSAVLTGLSRRRELLSTRLLGARRGALALLVILQSTVLVVAGLLLGLLVAAATLVPFALSTTSRVLPAGSPAVFLLVLAVVAVLSTGAGLLPALGVLRRRPAAVAARLG
ncbi:ABC transporter permease [Kineococcus sp. SYSU DK003]|uniref:ABC transporter permease n=1 Tax=Kineococcus sp. SYSU DK003 TaxID=3383124 RepID=UPI003D7E2929